MPTPALAAALLIAYAFGLAIRHNFDECGAYVAGAVILAAAVILARLIP